MKLKFFILLLVSVLLISGCSSAPADAPSASETALTAFSSSGPSISPSPTTSPIPSPSVTKPEAPEVDGCKSEVVDGKVLYYAEEGNTYGLESGELFGEFVQNVNIVTENENNVEGGWALSAKAAHALLQQASTETGEDVTKTKIVLPLDISGLNENDQLDINVVSPLDFEQVLDDNPTLLLEFGNSTLTFVNSFDTGDQEALLGYSADKLEINYVKGTGETGAASVYSYTFDLRGSNPISCYSEDFFSEYVQRGFFFGDAVVDIKSPLIITYWKTWNVGIDDIFAFQGLPVFLMANKSN